MFKFLKEKEEFSSDKEVVSSIKKLRQEVKELKKEIKELREDSMSHFQKMGLVRFNPFSEIGGNQSFSLALLDKKNNGTVITSYYSRENNRVYAKPLKEGKTGYVLTKEEKEAINKAKSNHGERKQ
jgi:hypothetical protein